MQLNTALQCFRNRVLIALLRVVVCSHGPDGVFWLAGSSQAHASQLPFALDVRRIAPNFWQRATESDTEPASVAAGGDFVVWYEYLGGFVSDNVSWYDFSVQLQSTNLILKYWKGYY